MRDAPTRTIKAVLFDFDGTLTRPGSLDFRRLREELATPAGAFILEYIQGLPLQRRRRALRILDRFEMEGAARSRPNAGAEDLIRKLQAIGLPLAIVSRNSRAAVLRALENFPSVGAADFEVIISRDDDVLPKPHPDGIRLAAGKMGVDAGETLVVGDFHFDINAGLRAGSPTVFLTNGRIDPPVVPVPDYVVENLSQVEALVRDRSPLRAGKLPNRLLARFLEESDSSDPSLIIGPGVGEDTAAVELGGEDEILILKSDPITFATDEMGYYALVVNANDVVTSGGTPRWLLTTLLFPLGTTAEQIGRLMASLRRWCGRLGVTLCGGHTEITDAVNKPVLVGQMVGTARRSRLLDKKRMRPGDQILLTKALAVEGTAILAREFPQALERLGVPEPEISRCGQFLFSPGIGVLEEAAAVLEAGGVSALHDVTEGGAATALEELARAGGHRIRAWPDQIPVFPETARICRLLDIDPLGLIGSGSLLIVCRPDSGETLRTALGNRGIRATQVGEVLGPGSGVEAVNGSGEPLPWLRFETDELPRAIEKLKKDPCRCAGAPSFLSSG